MFIYRTVTIGLVLYLVMIVRALGGIRKKVRDGRSSHWGQMDENMNCIHLSMDIMKKNTDRRE